jgi:hypothetical protein
VLTIADFPEVVYNVEFSPDGTTLYVNSSGSRIDALIAPLDPSITRPPAAVQFQAGDYAPPGDR